jgi:hypothetical protein
MATNKITASMNNRIDVAEESEQKKEVPLPFRRIDFKNFSYPISWRNETIPLKEGRREYYEHKNLGNGWFDFIDADYVDITGDARKEAVVQLHSVLCGVSCDGGSHLFYFYAVEKDKLKLLWRFETGSLGYGCGLKSFDLRKGQITLEVFNVCHFKVATLEPRYDSERSGGKFHAESITRFTFEFKGRKSALKKREVFPNPQEDVRNYAAQVSIGND